MKSLSDIINPYHQIDQSSQDAEICIILQTLIDNLIKIGDMVDPPIVKVWSLLEGSALIPYLHNKMSSFIYFEAKGNNDICRYKRLSNISHAKQLLKIQLSLNHSPKLHLHKFYILFSTSNHIFLYPQNRV